MAKDKNDNQPQYYLSPINTQVMNYNVYIMSASERLMYMVLLMIVGGAVGYIFYGGLFIENGVPTFKTTVSNIIVFAVGGILANVFFMKNIVASKRKKRINVLKQQFCDFLSSLANSLSAGMNMNDSLNSVYNDLCEQYSEDSYIVQEVKEIIGGIYNNIDIEEMLKQFGIRSGVDDISNFATVFATCYRTGGDIKAVIRRTADVISEKTMINSEIQTMITSNKMQMNIMNVIPMVVIFMMKNLSSTMAESFGSMVGIIGVTLSGLLTIAAYKMGQKIMDIKG